MKVDRHKAVAKQFGGKTYYFCSEHCLHAFDAEPDKHLGGTTAPEHAHEAHAHHLTMSERGEQLHTPSITRSPS